MDHPECWHCGYDIRGLPDGAKCPECGMERPWLTVAGAPPDPALPWAALALASVAGLCCLGPFSSVLALPAVVMCVQAYRWPRDGEYRSTDQGLAIFGIVMGLTVVVASVVMLPGMIGGWETVMVVGGGVGVAVLGVVIGRVTRRREG